MKKNIVYIAFMICGFSQILFGSQLSETTDSIENEQGRLYIPQDGGLCVQLCLTAGRPLWECKAACTGSPGCYYDLGYGQWVCH